MVPGFRMRALGVFVGFASLSVLHSDASLAGDATPVQLTVGDTTTLVLDGNPSTGYTWALDGTPGAAVTVDLTGYVKPALQPGERPLLGGAQRFEVLLTGAQPGRATLVFKYVKAGTPAPAKTKEYAVEVLDAAADGKPDDAQPDAIQDPTSPEPSDSADDLFADPNGN